MRVFACQTFIVTPKRLKWDLKARAGIFSSYEEVSKAYRVFDIEEGRVVVSRDVNFDESSFGLSPPVEDDVVDDLDFDSLGLDDEGLRQMEYQQTVKRTNCSSDEDAADRPPRTQWNCRNRRHLKQQ
ncbi:unnamed protein product [Peronospora belbahrii]|uniref:Retroviral polymerase SH3-like domain-containing protein n=1 Tax=Peronospora belbahrii TaxID=622444 RepID=A0ABN8D482_9STRA|nr:unnamed protein product [Peronospora belbahrii]